MSFAFDGVFNADVPPDYDPAQRAEQYIRERAVYRKREAGTQVDSCRGPSAYADDVASGDGERGDIGGCRSVGDEPKYQISLLDDATGKPKSQSTLLIEIAGATSTLFHDAERESYAVINCRGPREVHPVRSRDFGEFLSGEFYALTGKGCNRNAMSDAMNTIEARAKAGGDRQSVHLRVARAGERVYVDLCDEHWRVVEVAPDGWSVLDTSPINFIRRRGMAAFPVPTSGGSVALLRALLTVDDGQFVLLATWLTACLAGVVPFAVVVLQGEQGTGKSWTSRILRQFVDPSTVPLRSPPREIRDLLVSAKNSYLVALDNLSGLTPEISDALCRICTGGGIDMRQLYTDAEQVLVEIQRPIVCNGIDDVATRPDLLERSLVVTLPVIDSAVRVTESELRSRLLASEQQVFGALLDAVSAGLRALPYTKPTSLPRMADFFTWGHAVEAGLGFESGAFEKAYAENQSDAVAASLDASPLASALIDLMAGRDRWLGTPTELLRELSMIADNHARTKAWPLSPKGMGNVLRRLAPSLRRTGITFTQQTTHDRLYEIRRRDAHTQGGNKPPHPPRPPSTLISGDSLGADSNRAFAHNCPASTPMRTQPLASAHTKSFENNNEGESCGWGRYSGACVSDDVDGVDDQFEVAV